MSTKIRKTRCNVNPTRRTRITSTVDWKIISSPFVIAAMKFTSSAHICTEIPRITAVSFFYTDFRFGVFCVGQGFG